MTTHGGSALIAGGELKARPKETTHAERLEQAHSTGVHEGVQTD